MLILITIIFIVYGILIVYLSLFLPKSNDKIQAADIPVSIIISMRNEEKHIDNCLKSLLNIRHLNSEWEVILIDDNSTDKSIQIAETYLNSLPLTILQNKNEGKKSALLQGINNAIFNTILTTDADCTFPKNWLHTMSSYYSSKNLLCLCGGVQLADGNWFENLQQAESAALVGISAASLNAKLPTTCNGANLMYDKNTFLELGAFNTHEQTASGDDDLTLQLFFKNYPNKIGYLINNDVNVKTKAQKNFNQFIHQRIRWLSKGKHYIFPYTKAIQCIILIQLIAFYATFYLLFYNPLWAIALLFLKYSIDYFWARKITPFLNFKKINILFLPFYFGYIILVLLIKPLIKNTWKQRTINP